MGSYDGERASASMKGSRRLFGLKLATLARLTKVRDPYAPAVAKAEAKRARRAARNVAEGRDLEGR